MRRLLSVLVRSQLWLIFGLIVLDGVFFTRTDPHKVASVTLIIGFLLLTLTLYLCIKRVLAFAKLYGLPFSRHERRIALFGTGVICGLIGLQSMGELTLRDLLVVGPLAVMLYLYLSYGRVHMHSS